MEAERGRRSSALDRELKAEIAELAGNNAAAAAGGGGGGGAGAGSSSNRTLS